jgi:hypothetical protein
MCTNHLVISQNKFFGIIITAPVCILQELYVVR